MTELEPVGNLKDGDRRNVTVLFTDMEGFTSLSENLDPEEVDSLMNTLFSRFEAIVKRHDGTVEKYIGDAMVAAFGVPRIHEDDAVRAVHAALDFQEAVASVNRRLGPNAGQIRFRTGINTGLITTGRRGEFDVITGNTMNVAARLQQSAASGAILISQATMDECGSDFVVSGPLVLQVKGKAEPVHAWEVRQRSSQCLALEPRFRGHKELLDSMTSAYLRHDGKHPGGFLITGQAGIGKTALVVKVIETIRRFPDFRSPVLHARARRFRTLPFAVISDLIINYTDLDIRWTEARIAEALSERLGCDTESATAFARFLGESQQGNADMRNAFPLLNTILKTIIDKEKTSHFQAIIFIDNSNFMDRQSQDFLAWFMGKPMTYPFLILAEREPRQELARLFPRLQAREVPPLDDSDSEQLLREILGDLEPEGADLANILRQSEGIPLFIHAYGRYLRSNKDKTRETPGELPQTIQNLFLTTISSFNEDIRDFLKKITVFVHNFTEEDARFIHVQTDGDESIVDGALAFFEQEEILYQDKGAYYFRHDIFKKALYHSLLNYNKKILHQLVVKIMRRQNDPHVLRLVHHLIRSEQFEEAASLILGTPASSQIIDYKAYLDVLLERLEPGDLGARMPLLFRKAALLFNNGRTVDADEILKELLELAFLRGNTDYAAGAYHLLLAHNAKSYRFQKADFCGRKALSYYGTKQGNLQNAANVLSIQAINAGFEDRSDRVDTILADLDRMAGQYPELAVRSLECHMDLDLMGNDPARALKRAEQAKSGSVSQEDLTAVLAPRMGLVYAELGMLDEAAHCLDTYLASSPRQSVKGTILAQRAVIAHLRKEPSAHDLLDEAEFHALRSRNDFDHLDILRELFEAYVTMAEWEALEERVMEAIVLGQRHSAWYPTFTLLVTYIEALVHKGEENRARFFHTEARHIHDFNVHLHPRDRLVYHYHADKLYGSPRDRSIARDLLAAQLAVRGDRGASLLGLRTLSAISRDLARV